VLLFVRPLAAQVCGDADGSGTVTVTDGVQTLRSAAGLDSACTLAACDIDGSGSITVTDGVGVLRAAAGLDVTLSCSGGATGQPATLLGELKAIFKYGVGFATGTPVTACANAPDGSIDVTTDSDGTDTGFSSCQVDDDLTLDGDIIVGATTFSFSLLEADTTGDQEFISDFDGDLTLATSGTGKSLDGMVDTDTDSAGTMEMTFSGTTVVAGVMTGGTVTVDLGDSDIADSFTKLVFTFDGSGVATVVATQSNGATQSFRYDIASGSATPS